MATKNKKQVKNIDTSVSKKQNKDKNVYQFLLQITIVSVIIISVIYFTDRKGYFNPDNSNNHTKRKWDSFYNFTKNQDVDIVLVGNSHLYTGLSPENLSNALGANAFILASPGTTITDAYFCLKEAITVCKPKIAVIETFSIFEYNTHKFNDDMLSNQFKSFYARKNITQKLFSTPILFTSNNYVSAWSNTIRNHSFIFNDYNQIKTNIELNRHKEAVSQDLYLGRFICFTSGLEDTTLAKYDKPGFSANDYKIKPIGEESKKYLHKIIELCEQNNIKLVFLTLPEYYKQIKNYSAFKDRLNQEIKSYDINWLDLQMPYDTAAFTPDCFENVITVNQHMTYYGSLVSAYKLADYIKNKFGNILPNRSNDMNWKQLFYGSDGYFQNYSPSDADENNKIIAKNIIMDDNIKILEVDFVDQGQSKVLMAKVQKTNKQNLFGKKIEVVIEGSINGQNIKQSIVLGASYIYNPCNHFLFLSTPLVKDLSVHKITSVHLL